MVRSRPAAPNANGTPRWADNGQGKKIGNGWNFAHVFYANGQMRSSLVTEVWGQGPPGS